MADQPTPLDLGLDEAGAPVVLLGGSPPVRDMAALLRLAPGLAPLALARAANHFAHGNEYQVIADPAEFAAAYQAKLAAEDPAAAWQEGVVRLRDYGVPDFASIAPPQLSGEGLVFFAIDVFLGLPYRVEATPAAVAPTYTALPLSPLPQPPAPAVGGAEVVRRDPAASLEFEGITPSVPPPE
jgi:hypothetical protein